MPRTGLEPARLAALAPETSASTIPPPGLLRCKVTHSCWIMQVSADFLIIFFVAKDWQDWYALAEWAYAGCMKWPFGFGEGLKKKGQYRKAVVKK